MFETLKLSRRFHRLSSAGQAEVREQLVLLEGGKGSAWEKHLGNVRRAGLPLLSPIGEVEVGPYDPKDPNLYSWSSSGFFNSRWSGRYRALLHEVEEWDVLGPCALKSYEQLQRTRRGDIYDMLRSMSSFSTMEAHARIHQMVSAQASGPHDGPLARSNVFPIGSYPVVVYWYDGKRLWNIDDWVHGSWGIDEHALNADSSAGTRFFIPT